VTSLVERVSRFAVFLRNNIETGDGRADPGPSGVPGRVPSGSLIAVVKLIAEGVTGQAHGSLRGRHFGRLIMALDRLGRPMWCSRLPVSDSIAFLG